MSEEKMVKGARIPSATLGGGERAWWLAWAVALAVCVWGLARLRFGSADPDSEFYAFLVKQINEKPWYQWMVPDWLWRQNIPSGTIVRDHLVGHLIPPVLLSRLGYPSGQAIYAWNLLYVVGCLWTFAAIAKEYVSERASRALLWGLLLLPISFLYRVRANHEQFVLLCVALGAWGGILMRRNLAWALLVAVATHVCFLVKGVVFVMVPAAAGMVLLAHFFETSWRRILSFVALLGLVTASVALTALAYEGIFRAVSGQEFFRAYWEYQIMGRTVNINETHIWPVRKALNFIYYLSVSFGYSLPWSAVFLLPLHGLRKRRAPDVPASIPKAGGQTGLLKRAEGFAREWLSSPFAKVQVILVGIALQYIVLFSLSNRLAGRYIFPSFFFLGAAGFLYAWERWGWLRRMGAHVERLGVHRVTAMLWVCLVMLTLLLQNAGD